MLAKADILGRVDLGEEVEVPEWGGSVRVRGLTVAEWASLKELTEDKPPIEVMAVVVSRCVVDENGARMFTDEDVDALKQREATAIVRLGNVAQKRSGLTIEPEQAEKNS